MPVLSLAVLVTHVLLSLLSLELLPAPPAWPARLHSFSQEIAERGEGTMEATPSSV